jgi:hypothetical protein
MTTGSRAETEVFRALSEALYNLERKIENAPRPHAGVTGCETKAASC